MRRFLTLSALLAPAALTALALLALPVHAQQASDRQTKLLHQIGECLAKGLPPDWRQAEMTVDLKAPGGQTGDATYLMMRKLSGGRYEPFKPCDERKAARSLLEVRKLQPADKRGWKSAHLAIYSDGKFELTFDYPK